MALGSTEPLTEMSTRNLTVDNGWPVAAICEPMVYVGASMAHNPMGLHGLFSRIKAAATGTNL
jgi:hypothetical protein